MLDIPEQMHELWFDYGRGYSLHQFVEEMAGKIIWGPSQQLQTWGVDEDSRSEWKVNTNAQFVSMIEARCGSKLLHLSCEVINKDGNNKFGFAGDEPNASSTHATSAVTLDHHSEAVGGSNEEQGPDCLAHEEVDAVDWDTLIIQAEDGEAAALADEDVVYQAFGFGEPDEVDEGAPIPVVPAHIQQDMLDVGIPVDDVAWNEPIIDWDRDNPEMEVGIVYPSMVDFRLALRQYAIVHEFELCTEKSDRSRFRGCCSANGCPWKIRARTQADSSVRVLITSSS